MDALKATQAIAPTIRDVGGGFMRDGGTYARGGELGFQGLDFYVLGRCGVLGETSGAVAAAGLAFWRTEHVVELWERGRTVLSPSDAASEWAACGHRWGDAHLPDGPDYLRLAELLARICANAAPGGASLFAGWMQLPVPEQDRPKARAIHYANALRELRGALHSGAIRTAGLLPHEAMAYAAPNMAPIFGWDPQQLPDPATVKERWRTAESGTDIAMARELELLDDGERAELTELVSGIASTAG